MPWNGETLMLRSTLDPHELIPTVRKLVASIDHDVLVSGTVTFDDFLVERSATRRLGVLLVSLFSGSSLFLSAVGLYGVLAYSVNQRKREFGIRIALGAQTLNILRVVMQHGLKIVGTGLIIGIAAALVLARFIQDVLYGVSSNDPITLGIVVLVLALAGILACATRDPDRSYQGAPRMKEKFHHKDTKVRSFFGWRLFYNSVFVTFVSLW